MQRAVLELLCDAVTPEDPDGWRAVAELGGERRASRESVRRAMRRLADERYVELAHIPLRDPDGGRTQIHLAARISDQGLRLLMSRED